MYYVYLHIKSTDGTPFYVGKGKGDRAYTTIRRNRWWNHVYEKHGMDIILLEDGLSEVDALDREKYWIKRIGRAHLNNGTLVNLTGGGDGTTKDRYISDEFREKCSKRMMGHTINNGRKHSEEVNKLKGKKGGDNVTAKTIIHEGIKYPCLKDLYNAKYKEKWSYSNFTHRIRNGKEI